MKKKSNLIVIPVLVLLYPAYALFELYEAFSMGVDLDQVYGRAIDYQISIWISWVLMVSVAIYYKWSSKKRNFFFYITYGFLLLAFSIFGFYLQEIVNRFDVPSTFSDSYSLGVFTALQNFGIAAVLTAFLQAAVWWFSWKWHRK